MRVLFYAYPWAMQSPGGGEIMLLKTKEALEKEAIRVKLFDQWSDKLKDYDLLHVFGSVKDCLGLMQAAKSANLKVVLSPIFWSTLQRAIYEFATPKNKALTIIRHSSKIILPKIPSQRRKMFQVADLLLPNSLAEANQVSRLFGISKEKMHIVPLAADEKFLEADKEIFISKFGLKDFILSVGRIEPRKNQLNLIKALKDSGHKLVFIGSPVQGQENYFNECKKIADKNTYFIERLDHDSPLLASAYAAAAVFVLQGWFETPGLAALEAGLSGTKLAVTQAGSTKEYFRDFVAYFSPQSPKSIKEAVLKAINTPKNDLLKNHITNNYLWRNSALETIKGYKRIL